VGLNSTLTVVVIGALLGSCVGVPSPVTNPHSTSALSRRPRCDANAQVEIFRQTMKYPKPVLTPSERNLGILSTGPKYISSQFGGPDAWTDTGCNARGTGTVLYATVHSTDDLYTIDVKLQSADVNGASVAAGRYVRLEVRPSWPAHESVARRPPQPGDVISFSGPLIWDGDKKPCFRHGHMEIHPIEPIVLLESGGDSTHVNCPCAKPPPQ
jgi:hypothetical protein